MVDQKIKISELTDGGNITDTDDLPIVRGGSNFKVQVPISSKADKIPNSLNIADLPTGGSIGVAGATVDIYEKFNIAQTTSGQNITLPDPTISSDKKLVYVENTGTVDFTILGIVLSTSYFIPAIWNGTSWIPVAGGGGGTLSATQGFYEITAAFAANEVITLNDGSGASSGTSTKTGDTVNLGASAGAFNVNNLLQININGIEQKKGTDIIWNSSETMHFTDVLLIGDRITIRLIASS